MGVVSASLLQKGLAGKILVILNAKGLFKNGRVTVAKPLYHDINTPDSRT